MTLSEKAALLHSESAQAFLKEHAGKEDTKLLLKYAHKPEERWLSEQLLARKKLSKKIPEWAARTDLIFPEGLPLEQASSEETARIKSKLVKGRAMLDVTAGMGVDAYYLGKRFEQVDLFEQNAELAAITRYNLRQLGSTFSLSPQPFSPEKCTQTYDLIYVDPARRDRHKKQLVSLKAYTPDITAWLPGLLTLGKKVLIKTSPMLDITTALAQLDKVEEVWVISLRNECKELLFLCSASANAGSRHFRLFNQTPDTLQSRGYAENQLKEKAPIATGVNTYLYEPNASILKAFAADALALETGLEKLHPNTNLFTSQSVVPNFPGKRFKVDKLLKPYHKSLKDQRFNVISRNFYDKANKISQKLNIKPAGEAYLLAFTMQNAKGQAQVAFAVAKHESA